MSLTISCPHCQSRMRTPDDAVGKDVRCPGCQQVFRVEGDANVAPRRPGPAPAPAPVPVAEESPAAFEDLKPGPTARRPGSSALVDFLLFRRMMAPVVIQVLFWLGVIGCVIAAAVYGIGGLYVGFSQNGSALAAVFSLFMALVTITVGPFLLRIYAEMLILIFRIYEALTDIRDRLDRR
jgi:predicted Zn finger-like uncharacterized protein